MPKEKQNKRYAPEFKNTVAEKWEMKTFTRNFHTSLLNIRENLANNYLKRLLSRFFAIILREIFKMLLTNRQKCGKIDIR